MTTAPRPQSPATAADHAAPLVNFGREICGDLASALRREWLVTNGLGGYASGTVAGAGTRRYHGLLVAALHPPLERTVLVAALDEWITLDGGRVPLSTHEWADGAVSPNGYVHLQRFHLAGQIPTWTYAIGDALVEKQVWMEQGANATWVSYRLARSNRPLELEVTPLCTYRDFHALTSGGWMPELVSDDRSVTLTARPGAHPYRVEALGGVFQPRTPPAWYWGFARRAERERGLDDREDLLAPGSFRLTLATGEHAVLLLSAEPELHAAAWRTSLESRQERTPTLLRSAGVQQAPSFVQQLTLAADQFLVARVTAGGERGRTVIAGYHWFGDWGRDTMIALPGLTLATGRAAECAEVLRTFARYLDQGLLPNRFPDAGEAPEYNTVDATLWFFQAIRAYQQVTGDRTLVDDLLPALRDVIDWHERGTRHGIRVDEADGLLRCGEPGVQLTWMDARVGDWVVTPRTGKPVEVNALWHATLCALARFCAERDESEAAARYTTMAERAAASFRARFWRPERGYLADVLDTPDGTDDLALRPNQIFAVSLPDSLLEPAQARAVVESVGCSLFTTHGLRSLAPTHPSYIGHYGGGVTERDGAYHQGTVWTWLLGPYVEAHFKVYGDRQAARDLLRPLTHHLLDAGLGSISEIMDGDAPHDPRGCIAQAWSVGEALRVWKLLESEP